MPVMGFTKFERFFRAAGGVSVDRDDIKRYLDFVNDAIYDLLLTGQATAKANVRDIIEPWDLPVTKGLQESTHAFRRARSSSSSGPYRAQIGLAAWLTLTNTDSSGPGPVRWPQPAVRTERGPCRWRPTGRASSPSEMSAAARPNESPRPSARAQWPSGSPSKERGRHKPP